MVGALRPTRPDYKGLTGVGGSAKDSAPNLNDGGWWDDLWDWYIGGMGGFSQWFDETFMEGATAQFGDTYGRWEAGQASGWEVVWAGGNVVYQGYQLFRGPGRQWAAKWARRGELPSRGIPNTTVSKDYGGGKGQIRVYGPDGRAKVDYDFGHDHGAGDPHAHDWDWSRKRPRLPGRPLMPGE